MAIRETTEKMIALKITALLRTFAVFLLFITAVSVALPHAAFADSCTAPQTSIIKVSGNCASGGADNPVFAFLVDIIKFLSVGVGIAVTGGIIYGGIIFMTARGNSSQTQKAVAIITNAVIGLLLYAFMFAILNWLIPGGIFK